jgi:hypothetical protein
LQVWLDVLRADIGEDEADRLIAEAIEAADPVPDERVVGKRP